jgi:uncharacterized protein
MRALRPMWRVFLLLCLVAGPVHAASDLVPVPKLTGRVVDLTGTLTEVQDQSLDAQLEHFEARKGSQIVVLIVPTTQPEAIEQFGIRVADAWKPGRKGVDDGAILIVALKDHTLRIEVGYGLEGVLNDATCKRIISEVIVPYFKKGNFYGGIAAGVDSMMKVVDGEALPAPAPAQPSGQPAADNLSPLFFFGLVMVIVVGRVLRAFLGNVPAAVIVGLITTIAAWVLAGFFVMALFAGMIAFLLTLSGGRGPWIGGPGSYGGGFGGGFGGGGGFSGGGGGFGGGGASGRW